ncbi:MAG: TPM domain-containing protein [Deltaproteobacteria bacterium]|nr:MAG: TPM domain-containing protein [Deltaproteobacteria bacterium]
MWIRAVVRCGRAPNLASHRATSLARRYATASSPPRSRRGRGVVCAGKVLRSSPMLRGRHAAVALVAAAAAIAWAGAARAATPLPTRDPARSVYDTAGVLRPETRRALEALHRELFAKTGVMIVTVTVPRLVDETIEQFAVRVGQTWGVGRKGEDRGIVVALSVEDRRIFIATGYGVEGFLPDGRVGALLDAYVVPHLRRDDFDGGLANASAALARVVARHFGVALDGAIAVREPPRRRLTPGEIVVIALLLVALGYAFVRHPVLFLMLLSGGGHRGGGFGGGFGGGGGGGGFGGGGFGGGGAGRGF